jgi:hypothetical protein
MVANFSIAVCDFDKIGIPHINNALEYIFTDLKTKLINHDGHAKNQRKIFVDEYFRGNFKC